MMQSTFHALAAAVFAAAGQKTLAPSEAVPPDVLLSILAFLAAVACVVAGGIATAVCLVARRRPLAFGIAGATAAAAGLYLAGLVVAGLASRERTLPAGGRKYFCEMDCHLAYSVSSTTRLAALGHGRLAGAERAFFLVRVETWFDPSTISQSRGNAPLTPNPRRAFLVDREGRRYEVLDRRTLLSPEQDGEVSVPFTRALRPGESYQTSLVFDLPAAVSGARLWLGDPQGVEQLLIGHENGPFHRKVYFSLNETTAAKVKPATENDDGR